MKIDLIIEINNFKAKVIKETDSLVTIEFLKNKRLVKKLLKEHTPRQVIYILEDMFKLELQIIGLSVFNENITNLSKIDIANYKENCISGDAEEYKYYNFVLDLTPYELGWDVAESVSVSNIITLKEKV